MPEHEPLKLEAAKAFGNREWKINQLSLLERTVGAFIPFHSPDTDFPPFWVCAPHDSFQRVQTAFLEETVWSILSSVVLPLTGTSLFVPGFMMPEM